MGVLYTNNAIGHLSSEISADDTVISLMSGNGSLFPDIIGGSDNWFPCTLINVNGQREIVKVTGKNGDVFTVVRAQEGTDGLPWVVNDRFELRLTAAVMAQLVPDSRKVNGHQLNNDIDLVADDVGAIAIDKDNGGRVEQLVNFLNVSGIWTDMPAHPLEMGHLGGAAGDFMIDIHTSGDEGSQDYKYRIKFHDSGQIIEINSGLQMDGNIISKDSLNSVGSTSYDLMIKAYDATGHERWGYGPYSGGWDIHTYDQYGAWRSNPLHVDYETSNVVTQGQVNPGDYGNFDDRYNQKFLQGVRLGAGAHVTNNSNVNNPSGGPDGSVVTRIWSGGNWNAVDYRMEQYLLNDTWYNTGVSASTGIIASPVPVDEGATITILKNLTPYHNEDNEIDFIFRGVHQYTRNFISEEGYDWYSASKLLKGNIFIAFDSDMIIRHIDADATMIMPNGLSVAGIDKLPADADIYGTWKFDEKTHTVYQDAALVAEYKITENTHLRTQYAAQAALTISILQSRISIGRVRDGDADALTAWQNYIVDLDELTDAQLASADFVFPSTPQ